MNFDFHHESYRISSRSDIYCKAQKLTIQIIGLALDVNVTSFLPTTGVASFHMVVYQLVDNELAPRNGSLQLLASSKPTNFSSFELAPQLDVLYTAISSSSNNYPFDEYTVLGTFMLIPASGPAPVSVYLGGVIDSWYLFLNQNNS